MFSEEVPARTVAQPKRAVSNIRIPRTGGNGGDWRRRLEACYLWCWASSIREAYLR